MNILNTQVTPGWQRLLLAVSMSTLLAMPVAQAETTAGAVSPPPPGPYSAGVSGTPPQFRPDPELDGATAAYPPGMPAGFPNDNRRGALTRHQFMSQQEVHRKRMQQAFQQQQDMQQPATGVQPPATADAQMPPGIDDMQKRWDQLKAEQDKQWNRQKAEQAERWEQQQAEHSKRRQQQRVEQDQRRQQMQAEQQRMQPAPPQFRSQPGAAAVAPPQARPPQPPAYGYGYPPPPRGYGYGYPPPPYGYGAPGWAYPAYPQR